MILDTILNFRHIPAPLIYHRFAHLVGNPFQGFDWCGYRVGSTQQMLCWFELGRRWGTGMFQKWVYKVPIKPTILDIGSNYGVFGWTVKKHWPQAVIFGFEPMADAAIECRKLGCYANVHNVALGRSRGMTPLTLDTTDGALNASTQPGLRFQGLSFSVPVQDLDSYGLTADVAKIDVEGAELDVIAGGLNTLCACPAVIVECWTNRRAQEVSEMLRRKPVKLTRQDYLFAQ